MTGCIILMYTILMPLIQQRMARGQVVPIPYFHSGYDMHIIVDVYDSDENVMSCHVSKCNCLTVFLLHVLHQENCLCMTCKSNRLKWFKLCHTSQPTPTPLGLNFHCDVAWSNAAIQKTGMLFAVVCSNKMVPSKAKTNNTTQRSSDKWTP